MLKTIQGKKKLIRSKVFLSLGFGVLKFYFLRKKFKQSCQKSFNKYGCKNRNF
jgi:sugar phosphate permease